MRFIFKLLIIHIVLFINISNVYSREIILISHNTRKDKAKLIEKLLIEKIHIPVKLITIKFLPIPCKKNKNTIMHICVTNKGKVLFPHINNAVINNSMKIFRY